MHLGARHSSVEFDIEFFFLGFLSTCEQHGLSDFLFSVFSLSPCFVLGGLLFLFGKTLFSFDPPSCGQSKVGGVVLPAAVAVVL